MDQGQPCGCAAAAAPPMCSLQTTIGKVPNIEIQEMRNDAIFTDFNATYFRFDSETTIVCHLTAGDDLVRLKNIKGSLSGPSTSHPQPQLGDC